MLNMRSFTTYVVLAAVAVSAMTAGGALAADERESKLIAVLKSDAPAKDKAITCKHLAIYGSKAAVAPLAGLLADKELASWARIALEAIPDPAADEALRQAVGRLKGTLLVGAINSIGVRRDPKATDALVRKLTDTDPEVASAAAEALGRIGGEKPANALQQCLPAAPPAVRSAIAYGCILCAERFQAEGKSADAVQLYDTIRKADVPKQRHLEAIRGAILARGSGGTPLLVEQLKSADKALFGIGLRTARELPGGDVTDALVAVLDNMKPDRRAFLILALADRADPKALPAVLAAVKSGPSNVRVMAMGTLDRIGDASCVEVLLDAALEADAAVAQEAKSMLARLPQGDVDAEIAARLPEAAGKRRAVLIYLAGLRRIESALPALVRCTADADAACRAAAVAALGTLGGSKEVPGLVRILQKTQDPGERAGIDKALRTVSARGGAACVPHLMPLAKSPDGAIRAIGLHALACAGGPDALAAVKAAVDDKDEAVQDEAARTLSQWPDNWPDDVAVKQPLLAVARSGKKMSHRILALRGYLQYLQVSGKLKDTEKLDALREVLPLIDRRDEKRLVISVLGTIRIGGSLEMLVTFAADPATAEEACSAIVNLLRSKGGLKDVSKQQRRKALQTAVEKAMSSRTKKTAQQMLNAIR